MARSNCAFMRAALASRHLTCAAAAASPISFHLSPFSLEPRRVASCGLIFTEAANSASRKATSPARAALALFVVTFLVFLPAVNCDFVNWDDNSYVYENPRLLQGLSADGLRYAFTGTLYHSWAPLTVLSYLVDISLFGIRPAGFHLTNVVLHALASGVLCVALCRMTGRVGASVAVAAGSAIHAP